MNPNYLIASLFLLLEITIIIKNWDIKRYYNMFWFCDFAPILFAIGFFLNDIQFLKAIVSIGLIVQTITLFTFVPSRVVQWHKDPAKHRKIYILTDIFSHITTITVLVLTFSVPPEIQSLKYSFFLIIAIFFVTFIFTPEIENINLVYHSQIKSKKTNAKIKLPGQTIFWIFYEFLVVLLTFWIQYLLYIYL